MYCCVCRAERGVRVLRFFLVLIAPPMLSACAIHPLPENFSRSSTFEIVQKIRCEARGAIIDIALTDAGRGQIEAFLSAPLVKTEPKQTRIDRARRFLLPAMQRAAIGYSFKFAITEENDASGSARFEFPFSNGSFALGLSAGEDKRRKSERSFDLVEDFAQVLADPTLHCGPDGEDWKYPITGDIGLEEVVKTYVRLADLRIFQPPRRGSTNDAADSAQGAAPTGRPKSGGSGGSGGGRDRTQSGQGREIYEFTDELTFTTSFNGGITPTLQLKPVVNDFRLTQASASVGASREDVHSVTIALKAPTPDVAAREIALERFVPPVGGRGIAPFAGAPAALPSADTKGDVLTTLQNKKNRELRFPTD
jgi:hypothetical protein